MASKAGNNFDIIIIGAGISGINAAYRLQTQTKCNYAILEGRDASGGTWDLFRYPGIRSDSDLFTFGFPWNPWNQANPIAEADDILKYLRSSARKYKIDDKIYFNHKVATTSWSSTHNVWTLSVRRNEETELCIFTARFVIFCTGYYDYDRPLESKIEGIECFRGEVIHPQFWPECYDPMNKEIVVIGSGATAITLVPSLSVRAKKVTMLQRSPSYITSIANTSFLSRFLPRKLVRLNWIITARLFYLFCQRFPRISRWLLLRDVKKQLPTDVHVDPHFNPKYNPWDQRLCMCPDGDFFKSLGGRADVKTDTIDEVMADGIMLKSGQFLPADTIVTATGLKLQLAGGIAIEVDGKKYDHTTKFMWRGVMLQDLPNASFVMGYTNASWTLGADATAIFIGRLIRTMVARNQVCVTPRVRDSVAPRQLLNLSSTYITAAARNLPLAGDRAPWLRRNNYFDDLIFSKYGSLDDETLEKKYGAQFGLTTKD